MKKAILILLYSAWVMTGHSQIDSAIASHENDYVMPANIEPPYLAQGDTATFQIKDTRAGFKITTDYRCVYEQLLNHFDESIRSYYIVNKKTDGARYKHYTVYFNEPIRHDVLKWISENQ